LDSGNGFEAQIRYNPSSFSIGLGIEMSRHDSYAFGLGYVGVLCPTVPVEEDLVEYQDVRLTGLFVALLPGRPFSGPRSTLSTTPKLCWE